ncbi:MAG: IS30 family transposase [Deltaproteobacteria bacterium]|nr:IS30 family transposase [Deltaproteobacteria bacterium]
MRTQQRQYRRLTDTEREEISRGLAGGEGLLGIAKRLGRVASTVSREVGRNSGQSGYRAYSAGRRALEAASSRKRGKRVLTTHEGLRNVVEALLVLRWSPEQIAQWLKVRYPGDHAMRISHEAIYQYIYVLPRGELKRTLIMALRQERGWRRKKRTRSAGEENRGKITDMLSIEERPAEVADRTVPGHWEGDLIVGKYKRSALGTLVERTTRTTLLVRLGAKKNATCVRKAYARRLRTLPAGFAKSLTYDQGKEMSEHRQFTKETGITVYFAHPGSPWERGTNENTNGLIRQFFPKGTDFTKVSAKEISHVEWLLNGRPRKSLHWRTPDEACNLLLR